MKYSHYLRLKRAVYSRMFSLLFSRSFKRFGTRCSVYQPDIIEGEQYISLHDNVSISTGCWLLCLPTAGTSKPELVIGKGATIGRFAHIVSIDNVSIGEKVLIADNVYISDNLHSFVDVKKSVIDQAVVSAGNVKIADNVWIGEGVSIVGASIGRNSVIGANSVVTHDIPEYSVAVGSPARVIKQYNSETKLWEKVDAKR
ncbi:DapH/DapD/GlmU-related protein [Vibrio tubiashii]|uniref:acyltransferase n=1 Tax=Vibrio tubiashii TaxID=29498 RepID=UPI00349EC6D2